MTETPITYETNRPLVAEGGLEPPHSCEHWGLGPACLPFHHSAVVRVAGIEPASACARGTWPTLSLDPEKLVGAERVELSVGAPGIEPRLIVSKTIVLTVAPRPYDVPRRKVLTRWQLAQTNSHFASSRTSCFKERPSLTIREMERIFLPRT